MTVQVLEVKASAALAAVELHIIQGPGPAAIGDVLGLDPGENSVELLVGDVERVVIVVQDVPAVEVHGKGIIDLHRGKMPIRAFVAKAKDLSEELRRCHLVFGRNDGMVQRGGRQAPSLAVNSNLRYLEYPGVM